MRQGFQLRLSGLQSLLVGSCGFVSGRQMFGTSGDWLQLLSRGTISSAQPWTHSSLRRRIIARFCPPYREDLILVSRVPFEAIPFAPTSLPSSPGLSGTLSPGADNSRISRSTSEARVPLTPQVLQSLAWWTSPALAQGCLFRVPQRVSITTDASLFGWGAHLGSQLAQGQWSVQERGLHINILELRAIFRALRKFAPLLRGLDVLIRTDNVAAKAHINRQGGTRSKALMREASRLFRWAESHLASIHTSHISGSANVQADALSRSVVDQTEWSLDPLLFQDIVHRFGLPAVDLFASESNHQLPRFYTRFPVPGAEAVDALISPWPCGLLLYAFPPLPLISRVIRKLLQEQAELILLAPFWPRQPWFADLMALSVAPHWQIPADKISLWQGCLAHPDPQWFRLTVWRLSGSSCH
ncbi:uncharacterized protein LOC117655422 [Pantherophis guttatus]|uniref:Uncharacterized protein LOC117655422 n=1 Tax=Pantherophis guttatus TaxID=94885 RepID=A0A6P9ANZ3_PANGU|nr:uncharacterized protein LOC117655422 [Pantherophis guttatus]